MLHWIMYFVVEFLTASRVLSVRLYSRFKRTAWRVAVEDVRAHGCYRPCIPILLDGTHTESAAKTDVEALRAALGKALPDSPIATLVKSIAAPPGETSTEAGRIFTTRADALRWLAAGGD